MSKVSPAEKTRGPPPIQPSAVWAEFNNRAHFFSKLSIARDGGFAEVPALFTKDRFLWAVLALVFLFMNLYTLFIPNIDSLLTEDWTKGADEDGGNRLLINGLINQIFGGRLRPQIMMALLELSLLVVLILQIAICLCWICRGSNETRWHGVQLLLWSKIPNLMTFSAMRLLNFVTPSVFIMELSNEFTAAHSRGWSKFGLQLIRFLLVRIICAFVGLEAFMIKFLDAATAVTGSETHGWEAIALSVAFLNQILGIVQVNPLLQKRLFVFLFGGEDSFLSDREAAVEHTWCAMVAKTIWEESRNHRASVVWFLAVMLSYSDVDFQRLTLNEKSRRKEESEPPPLPSPGADRCLPPGLEDGIGTKAVLRKKNNAMPDWLADKDGEEAAPIACTHPSLVLAETVRSLPIGAASPAALSLPRG